MPADEVLGLLSGFVLQAQSIVCQEWPSKTLDSTLQAPPSFSLAGLMGLEVRRPQEKGLKPPLPMGPLFPSGHRPQSHLNQSWPWALESDQRGFKS